MVNWLDKDNIIEIIKLSNNKTDILNKLKLKNNGGNYNTLTHFIEINNIDISHFIVKKRNYEIKNITKFEDALVENSTYKSTNSLKKRLYNSNLKKRECELCGQNEYWNGKKMSLILDHINGISNDNRLENLRIVCPNCNATLETHCRGYRGLEEKKKYKYVSIKKKCTNIDCFKLIDERSTKCRSCTRKSQSKKPDINFTELVSNIQKLGFKACGEKYNVDKSTVRSWYKNFIIENNEENILNISIRKYDKNSVRNLTTNRKVERPEYEILINEIQELGFTKTGIKYNVSDNSIRKWVKYYIKYEGKENILEIKI